MMDMFNNKQHESSSSKSLRIAKREKQDQPKTLNATDSKLACLPVGLAWRENATVLNNKNTSDGCSDPCGIPSWILLQQQQDY